MKQSRSLFNAAGCLLALTSLLINSSCSQDEFAMMPVEDGQASFSISLPGEIGTRSTFGDSYKANVNTLYWTLFEVSADDSYKKIGSGDIKDAFQDGKQNVSLPLVVGKTYRIAFCAMNHENKLVSYKDGKLFMNYANTTCNAVNDDVFTGVSAEIDMAKYDGYPYELQLTRPLAQINWGSTDFEEPAVAAHLQDTKATVTYTSGLYGSLDIINGSLGLPQENVTFPAIVCGGLPEMEFPIADSGAKLVAMNYALVASEQSATINCDIAFEGGYNTKVNVNNAPVQANFRTNIYGGLITNSGQVSVKMEQAFDSPDNSERYLTPETRRVMNELNAKKSEIEIPAGETIDLTGLGKFNLTVDQKIKLDGALILDSQQLYMQSDENSDTSPTVTFEGSGIIYSTKSSPVYVDNEAKGIFKGITINCESTSSSALKASGDIELYSVTIKSRSNGIYIAQEGLLKAENCKIVADGDAVDIEGATSADLSDCEITSSSGSAVSLSGCGAYITNCSLYAHGNTNTINIDAWVNVYITDCIVESEKASALLAQGENNIVYVKAGYLHSKNKETIIVADEALVNLTTDDNEVIPVVVSESGATIHVGENADVTISAGRYLTFGDYAPVIISGSEPSLTINEGEFITDADSSIMELEGCSDKSLNLMGGEYSGGYMASNKNKSDLQPAEGYKLDQIDITTPEGFKLKYRISSINANN